MRWWKRRKEAKLFSGIVQAKGICLPSCEPHTLTLATPESLFYAPHSTISTPSSPPQPELGESIAVNGVCLTLESFSRLEGSTTFPAHLKLVFHLGPETLQVTTLGNLPPHSVVNLERSLCLGDRLSGHLVYGHVDGLGTIHALAKAGDDTLLTVQLPAELSPFCVKKGSLSLDGVSLTINQVRNGKSSEPTLVEMVIVPHTLKHTRFSELKIGDVVHIEIDMIARYLANLVKSLDSPKERKSPPYEARS